FHPEGDLDVGFVLLDLTVGPQVARPVEHFHAGDVPHGLGGLPARVLHRLLPAVGGVAYQFDHLDDGHALTLHHAVSRVVCAAGGGLLRGRVPSEGGFFSHREDRLEEPAEVAPQDAPGLFLAEAGFQEGGRQPGEGGHIGQVLGRLADAVKIRAQPQVFRADHLGDVDRMPDQVLKGSPGLVGEEAGAEVQSHHPALLGQGHQLLVPQVAGVGMDRVGVGVGGDDGPLGRFHQIPEAPPGRRGEASHPPPASPSPDHLPPDPGRPPPGPLARFHRIPEARSDRWETSSTQPRASHARTTSRPNRVSPPPASGSRQPSASSFRWFQVRPRARTPSRWKISTISRLPWRISPPSMERSPPTTPAPGTSPSNSWRERMGRSLPAERSTACQNEATWRSAWARYPAGPASRGAQRAKTWRVTPASRSRGRSTWPWLVRARRSRPRSACKSASVWASTMNASLWSRRARASAAAADMPVPVKSRVTSVGR